MSLASRKLIQATAGATTVDTGDDDFANVVLLLDGDGTSDDNNETFTDSSTNGFTVTENGDVVQGSFSPYGDNWSNYFGGDSGLNFGDVTAVDFDANDWTMELWWNPQDLSTGDPFVFKDNVATRSFQFRHHAGSSTELKFLFWSSNTLYASTTTSEFVYSTGFDLGEWYHIALVHDSGTFECFVNGTSIGTWTPAANNIDSGTDTLNVGYYSGGTPQYASGYLSNVRVVNGTALYTSSFTPSTSPLTAVTNTTLLTCQSNSFKDNSSNDYSVTLAGTPKVTPFSPFKNDDARDITTDGGSGYFEGSGDYLSVGGVTTEFDFGTGDFTIECWVNLSATGQFNPIVYLGRDMYTGLFCDISSSNNPRIIMYPSSTSWRVDGSTSLTTGQWYHLAFVRNGSSFKIYVDGVEDGSITDSRSIGAVSSDASSVKQIGYLRINSGADRYFNGYISSLRVVKGTAVYTSAFTPPTAPLTVVTNTELLTNFQDAGIYDRSGINNLDTVGDARLGFAPIYGTGSLAFDGTGDYLSMPVEPHFDFGTADFTIEGWVNLSATGQFNPIVYFGRDTHTGIVCDVSSSNNPRIIADIGASWTTVATGSTALEKNRWYHLAFVRNGSSFKIYVDGVEDASATDSGSITAATSDSSSVAQIGYLRTNGGADRYFNGYLDDVRVTKGIARYTSAFTPPTEIDISLDTHREYVTFFIDGDGTVNGQNNTFTDSSTNGFTVTESGSVAQGVFSPYGDNWANYFDGANDYLELSGVTNEFDFGSDDWTMECWVYLQADSDSKGGIIEIYKDDNNYIRLFRDGGPDIQLRGVSSGSDQFKIQSSAQSKNVWIHIAGVRDGSTIRLFVDGTQVGTDTSFSIPTLSSPRVTVGLDLAATDRYFKGYISNARVVKGTAVYTSAFTPPTSPLTAIANTQLLACQSNRFIDESTNNFTLTVNSSPKVTRFSPFESNKPYDITTDGGSAYFDGVKTTQLYAGTSNVIPATGDFTIEGWVYFTDVNTWNNRSIFFVKDSGTTVSGNRSFQAVFNNNGTKYDDLKIALFQSNSSYDVSTFTHTFEFNEWYHVAVTRTGQTIECFINGTSIGTDTNTKTSINQTTEKNYIGSWNSSSKDDTHPGYIGDFRITHARVYTSNFTPPTSPLTAIANTELLLNFQDSAIPDLSGLNNIDTVGNAKVSGTDPTKYGSNAMQFDGSGDYLDVPANSALGFGSGAFTIECWAYFTASTAYQAIVSSTNYYTSGYNGNWLLRRDSNSLIAFATYNGTSTEEYLQFSASTSLDTWYHIALVREGTGTNQTKLYLDGTLKGSMTVSKSLDDGAVSGVRIGKDTQNADLSGFIDDLRITKGVARYTSNFTPPTDALPKF